MIVPALATSPALWNRSVADLDSDEILAQVLDHGTVAEWRVVYQLARDTPTLRRRILEICQRVLIAYPNLFIAAMGALGENVDPWPKVADPKGELTA